jgi:hypothetical protein
MTRNLGFYNYYKVYNGNRLFDPYKEGNDLIYPYYYLAQEAWDRGISVSTIDTEPLDSYDAIIFLDYPGRYNWYLRRLIYRKYENVYLFLLENEMIKPDNYDSKNWDPFKRVYTWNDDIVNGRRIVKLHLPNRLPYMIKVETEQRQFCCMVASYKMKRHILSLYTERVNVIRWFERNQPDRFDLYGKGWNNFLRTRYPSYRGPVDDKHGTLKRYRFAICYENAIYPGYISEKIFDCFRAGCIPIYWGAPNVTDYIPGDTFIDARTFTSYDELYSYMNDMDDKTYRKYIQSIESFMNGQSVKCFGSEYFSNFVLSLVGE